MRMRVNEHYWSLEPSRTGFIESDKNRLTLTCGSHNHPV